MAKIGDILETPELGWQRIQDDHPYIIYTGEKWQSSLLNPALWSGENGTYITVSDGNTAQTHEIQFKFMGTKLRLISLADSNSSNNILCTIDGVDYEFSEFNDTALYQVLVFEKLDLENKEHEVSIKSSEAKRISLDAIDIDQDGYMVASVGCQLLQPEEGWQRIDDSHPYILYFGETGSTSSHDFYYNKTFTYAKEIKIKFYGTKFRFISGYNTNRTAELHFVIDGNTYSTYSLAGEHTAENQQKIIFEILDLEEGEHLIDIFQLDDKPIVLDAIDIDSDGYLIPQIGCQLLQPEEGWQRIDDTHPYFQFSNNWETIGFSSSGGWNNTESYSRHVGSYYQFRFYGTKLRITDHADRYRDESYDVEIDGEKYTYNGRYEETTTNMIVFEKLNLDLGVHNVKVIKTSSDSTTFLSFDAIDIDEDGRMLTEEEYESMLNKHLIKFNDKYYTIEEDNLVEITDTITSDLIKEKGISVNTLTTNQSLLPDKFKLVSRKDNTFNIKAIQSQQELVVASNDFYTTIQSNIDFFDVIGITDTGTSIKVAFSIDSGATWKTYDTQFKDLSITIPNKPYEELTQEELIQWNNSKDIISEQGIDIANLSNIDFNTLNMEKIRFAYVISINSKDDKCCTSQLKWQFDSKGTMKSMTSDELEIELLQDSIKIMPKISSNMMKVNFTNGSTIEMAEIKEMLNDQMNGLFSNKYLETEKYASETNDGNVKKADVAKIIEGEDTLAPGLYRRTDTQGNVGYFPLEIVRSENAGIQQFVITNATNGKTETFECMDDLSDVCLYVQAVKELEGNQNVNGVIFDFTTDFNRFNYGENIEVNEGICIKTEYDIPVVKNGTFYETDEIDKNDYLIIESMEMK